MRKKITALLLTAVMIGAVLVSCAAGRPSAVKEVSLIHEPEFGGVYIKLTIDEFNAKGYEYGDSVNVSFSNGYTLEDIPY